jgi:hypothetical protein
MLLLASITHMAFLPLSVGDPYSPTNALQFCHRPSMKARQSQENESRQSLFEFASEKKTQKFISENRNSKRNKMAER